MVTVRWPVRTSVLSLNVAKRPHLVNEQIGRANLRGSDNRDGDKRCWRPSEAGERLVIKN